jgi:hypothetical protein
MRGLPRGYPPSPRQHFSRRSSRAGAFTGRLRFFILTIAAHHGAFEL